MNFDKAGVKREVSLKSCCVRDRGLSLPSTGVQINFHQANQEIGLIGIRFKFEISVVLMRKQHHYLQSWPS